MTRPTRRSILAGTAAALAVPGVLRAAVSDTALARLGERAGSLDQLHSLTVALDGRAIFAEAFRGPPLGRVVNVKSVSKTIVAALTGAAIDRGVLPGVEAPVIRWLEDQMPAARDPRHERITVEHLITMQAGLERTSGGNYGAWVGSRNWVSYALSRPFVAEPGARMQYSTGAFHLMGAVLARASGRSLLDLARDWLGDPLDMEIPPWTRDPQGLYMGGNNMALSPAALLRFGEMARQGGEWNGRQVLSHDWIDRSWTVRTRSPFSGDDYGYGWFLARIGGEDVRYARGYGGQMLYVAPRAGMSVVVISDPTRPARSAGYAGVLRRLLAEDILPLARL